VAKENMTQKILENHRVAGSLKPGEACAVAVDHCLMQDATGAPAALEYELLRQGASIAEGIFAIIYIDHNVLSVGPRNPNDWKFLQTFCAKHGIWYSSPMNGICHQADLELFVIPGTVKIGSDSHTPTSGAVGCLAFGVGGLDVADVLAGNPFEMTVPTVLGVRLSGVLQDWASGKDVILELLRRLGVSGANGKVIEFFGPGAATLSVEDRVPIANMGTETGATSVLFPADERVGEFFRLVGREQDFVPLAPDEDAEYDEVTEINLGAIEPLIACPSSPDNVVPVREVAGLEVDQVCFGSSANSMFPDLWLPAYIFEQCLVNQGKTVPSHVRITVNPGSRNIERTAEREGIFSTFSEIGPVKKNWAVCGPCVGQGDSPPEGVRSVRTFNRNFPGRSGTPNDSVYLSSPAVAAATAVRGKITDPRDLGITPPPEIPVPEYVIDKRFFLAPLPPHEREAIVVFRASTITPPPRKDPLPDLLSGEVLLVLGDDISTGTISPDGAKWMAMRADFQAIADGTFIYLDEDFTQEKQVSEFSKRARETGGGFIVAGSNYGQGSSREHAAIGPMILGVTAVFAKEFRPLHRVNLINFGIVPLVINEELYAAAVRDERWELPAIREAIASGRKEFFVVTPRGVFPAELNFTPSERNMLLAGGKINYRLQQSE